MNNGTVYISLTSHLPGEEANVRRMKADLKRLQKDDFHALRLSYEQVLDIDSGEKMPEIMTFRIGEEGRITRISMKRPKTAVLMEFEEGKTCFVSYPTPAGILDVQILTRKVEPHLLRPSRRPGRHRRHRFAHPARPPRTQGAARLETHAVG